MKEAAQQNGYNRQRHLAASIEALRNHKEGATHRKRAEAAIEGPKKAQLVSALRQEFE